MNNLPLVNEGEALFHIARFAKAGVVEEEITAHQSNIEEDRFGFEPEITAKVARGKYRIYEVGISYYGRTYQEGKKIGWRDGFRAIYAILKYNVWKRN